MKCWTGLGRPSAWQTRRGAFVVGGARVTTFAPGLTPFNFLKEKNPWLKPPPKSKR